MLGRESARGLASNFAPNQSEFIQLADAALRQFAKRPQCPPRSTTPGAFDRRGRGRTFRMNDLNAQAAARIADGLELDLLPQPRSCGTSAMRSIRRTANASRP